MPTNKKALILAGLLMTRGGYSYERSIPKGQVSGLKLLIELKAIVPGPLDSRYASCSFCGLHRGPVFRCDGEMHVQCPDCGPYKVDLSEQRNWSLDIDWMIRKLRAALNIAAHVAIQKLYEGVWQIGLYKKRAVILAERIELVVANALNLFHGKTPRLDSWVITPRPLSRTSLDPLLGTATWWHLEDCFAIHGNGLRFVGEEGGVIEASVEPRSVAVHGPFSETFEWVHIPDWSNDPIRLTAAQAAIFEVLWRYRGQPQSAETIMNKAHLASDKLIDVFKIKAANRGDPTYEGPMHAYETLVVRNRRMGLYSLSEFQ
ncbi:hypothetical protein [Limnohabitans sp.]|uniref:hypothetical protein n=1 Tax=Limnohabitans sp. TaxID=1907725 RepID=UPI00286EE526|nr:hypothetical protein [Limnohabitans sp.]